MAVQLSKVYKKHYDSLVNKNNASLPEKYIPFLLEYASNKTKSGRGYYQFEDILAICMASAVKAAKTYNAELGDFSTYVKPFIRGAIVDHYRDGSKRNADVKRKILGFITAYEKQNGRFPTEAIILKELEISKVALDTAVTDLSRRIVNIDDVVPHVDSLENNITFDSVKSIFNRFDAPICDIFRLKFIDEESDIQIAAILNIQPKYVTTLYNNNIDKLRELLIENNITLESYYESVAMHQYDI